MNLQMSFIKEYFQRNIKNRKQGGIKASLFISLYINDILIEKTGEIGYNIKKIVKEVDE